MTSLHAPLYNLQVLWAFACTPTGPSQQQCNSSNYVGAIGIQKLDRSYSEGSDPAGTCWAHLLQLHIMEFSIKTNSHRHIQRRWDIFLLNDRRGDVLYSQAKASQEALKPPSCLQKRSSTIVLPDIRECFTSPVETGPRYCTQLVDLTPKA